MTTTGLETMNVMVENTEDWTISSQAPNAETGYGEGSETIEHSGKGLVE